MHPEAPRKGLGTWLTVVGAFAAAVILVWGIFEMTRARTDVPPTAADTEVPADTLTAAPPDARLYREVFSVSDAVLHRGTWFVLDSRGAQVHRIWESGTLLGSFGRRGEGPGELRRPAAIASREGTVIILDDETLHLFDLDGDHLEDRRVRLGACADGSARDLLSQPTGLLLLVSCRALGRMEWTVILEPRDGPSQTLAVRASDPGVVDVGMASAVLGAHPRGFVFGLAGDDCLDLFNPSGARLGEICHDWIERLPIPGGAEDRLAGLRARAQQSGVRLIESSLLPPFVQVFQVGGALAYQVPLPEDLETFRLVTRGSSGEAVALALPVAEGMFGTDGSVLLWWEDLEGTRIAIRRLGVS